jgi:thioredoxin
MDPALLITGLVGVLLGLAIALLVSRKLEPAARRRRLVNGALYGFLVGAALGSGLGAWVGFPDAYKALPQIEAASELADRIAADRPVLADFYIDGCAPCRRLAPTIAQLAKEYGDRIEVVRINGHRSPDLAQRHHVPAYPTVVLFAQGREWQRMVGAKGIAEYRSAIDEALAAPKGARTETERTDS